ncbi:type VI secretion system tip protein VgrG [Sphingomonas pokkalii]|uniref:Rhs element Vgr protein n=1 Tax=Sphingomonas pokkalii TaxID=2175090 RepID=A0A2U0SFG5_9SPHN|nr:type VI secretion system tip protein VgrG [Sphingomonas pokkalii]PVX30080.1 Rhs element Vgr protein [Sphingomonas pokkalii]
MSAPSPVDLAVSNVDLTIFCNGAALGADVQIVSIDVWSGVNKLPKARLVVSDGSAADETFPISETDALIPGATISIALGYNGSEMTVFDGVVYRQGLEIAANGPSRLVVEATDKAMAMTLARQNALFQNITDSQLCQKLITAAGLTANVTATSVVHENLVQYYATSWDMVVLRAQASGMVVIAEAGRVTVAPPDTASAPVLTLTFGSSILDFRADMDASTQYTAAAIQSVAWDPATQQLAQASQPQADVTTPGDISSDELAKVFGIARYVQQTAGAMEVPELTQWSSAELLKQKLAKIRGSVRFQGSTLAVPGCMVTLAGLGGRFNGDGYVSEVHHHVSDGLWRTSVQLGLSPNWFAAVAPQIAAPGASGQLPPATLQSGTVLKIDQDPDGEFRVLVSLPLLQAASGDGVWARFGSFYASNAIGACFYPEIGDEVVVAFLSGDPRYPVILGSLYSKAKPPPVTPQSGNNTKKLVSRAGVTIEIDEDKKVLRLTTPANQSIVLDDDGGAVTLKDKNGNSIALNGDGIAIKSGGDITLSAGGSVSLTAQKSLTATGTSSAKISSTGSVQISGNAGVALNP